MKSFDSALRVIFTSNFLPLCCGRVNIDSKNYFDIFQHLYFSGTKYTEKCDVYRYAIDFLSFV